MKIVKCKINLYQLFNIVAKTVTVKVSESEYTDCLTEQCIFEFREMFTIKETGQTSYEDVPFKLEKPTINITVSFYTQIKRLQ